MKVRVYDKKRCIVNVATGEFYLKMQDRLKDSFKDKPGIDLLLWRDEWPKGSKSHSDSPYGFKVHAIIEAFNAGYTSILWLDSPAYAVKEDISPIFDSIEQNGYYVMSHIDPLQNYVTRGLCKKMGVNYNHTADKNLPSGSCYGFDLDNIGIQAFFKTFMRCESLGLFKEAPRHDESILALLLVGCGLPIFTFDPLFQSESPECVIKSGG